MVRPFDLKCVRTGRGIPHHLLRVQRLLQAQRTQTRRTTLGGSILGLGLGDAAEFFKQQRVGLSENK